MPKLPIISGKETIKKLEKLRRELEYSSTILVNFQRRYTVSYQRLKNMIKNKTYGDVISIEINYSRGLETNGSHMIDLLSYIFPDLEFELLWVETGRRLLNPNFVIRLSNDLIVSVIGIEALFHNIDLRVTCDKARLSIEHTGMSVRVERVRKNELYSGFYRLYDEESDELGEAGFDHAFDYALIDLIKSHETCTQPTSNLTTALSSQAIVETVLKATEE